MNEPLATLKLSWHVVVRNWVVYRKDFLANISPTLADPALMMASLGMGLSPFIGQINGLSYAQYLAPGMIATTALFTAFFESSYGFYIRLTFESIFKAMLTTPIGPREIMLGEFLWVFIRAAIMATGVGLVLACMGILPNPWALPLFPLIGGLLSLPCAAIGLLAAAKVRNINQFQTVYSFLIAPIYFLSGVFFPLQENSLLWVLVQFSPFYHGVRLLQLSAWGQFPVLEILIHLGALLLFTLLLGFLSFRLIQRKLVN
ncbi:MAG: ABC transporter permease [Blastochloris sp.]|nr:ABC transporter permease [Blastochloris sp.]